MKKIILAAMLPLLLAACGKTIDGTFVEPTTKMKLEFEGDSFRLMGQMPQKYVIDGEQIIAETPMGKVPMFLIKDSQTIEFPMGGVNFVKQ